MKAAIFLTYPFRPHTFHYKFLKNELLNNGIKYVEYKGLKRENLNYYRLINSNSFFQNLNIGFGIRIYSKILKDKCF